MLTRDAMGRTLDHKEFKDDGITVTFRRQNTYNAASQVLTEATSGTAGASTTTYNYGINEITVTVHLIQV